MEYNKPIYSFTDISATDLEEIRSSRRKNIYKRIDDTQLFHVIIFKPEGEFILSSNQLCVCHDCIEYNFEKCTKFKKFILNKHSVNPMSTRSYTNVEEESDYEDSNFIAGSLVTVGSIFAIKADSQKFNFYLLICDAGENVHTGDEPIYYIVFISVCYYFLGSEVMT